MTTTKHRDITTSDDHVKRDEVLAAEQARCRALVERNTDHLRTFMSDDFEMIHASGRTESRDSFLTGIAGHIRYRTVERHDLHVMIVGDVAIMRGAATIVVETGDQVDPVTIKSNISQVWRHEPDGWRQVLYHGSRFPA